MLLWCSTAPQVLLLDEITVDLDVLARADLLEFLKEESEQRKATIVYVSYLRSLPFMHACLPASMYDSLG